MTIVPMPASGYDRMRQPSVIADPQNATTYAAHSRLATTIAIGPGSWQRLLRAAGRCRRDSGTSRRTCRNAARIGALFRDAALPLQPPAHASMTDVYRLTEHQRTATHDAGELASGAGANRSIGHAPIPERPMEPHPR